MRTGENYPAGHDLDLLVDEVVMSGSPGRLDGGRYSTVLLDAFGVAEKMEERGWRVELARIVDDSGARHWEVLFAGVNGLPTCLGVADELPLAICRAALGAVSAQVTA